MKRRASIITLCTLLLIGGVQTSRAGEPETRNVSEIVNTLAQRIKLSGYAQAGYDYYSGEEGSNQFRVARVILMADARVNDRIRAYAMYNFRSSSLLELWFSYRLSNLINIKAGQFKTPFSIENPISPTLHELIGCSSLVTSYMIGGGSGLMMKGSTGRDIGLTVYGDLFGGTMSYDLAVMNGAGRNNSDDNRQKDFVARLSWHPWKWFTVSGSALKGTGNISVRNEAGVFVSDVADISGLKANGNFRRDRYAIGAELKSRQLNLRSEYMTGKDGETDSKGFYATGTVNNVVSHLDWIVSYDHLDIWSGRTNRYSTGLQYWFYPKCRLQVGYGLTKPAGEKEQHALLTQVQVRF